MKGIDEYRKIRRAYGHIPDNKAIEYPEINFLSNDASAHRGLGAVLKQTVTSVNLAINLPISQAPYDQGLLGSCTANGLAFCYVFDEIKQKNTKQFMPSRLFIYYNERKIEGTVNQDSGAQIYDGVSALQRYGVCSEEQLPYDARKFTREPSANLYKIASQCQLKTCYKLAIAGIMSDHAKAALNSGFPIVMGFKVYESFETVAVANTGIMPIPKPSEKLLGGHCVVIVGYDDKKNAFLVRNSWGTGWGCRSDGNVLGTKPRGYFWMPYSFVNSPECCDFWVLSSVSAQGIAGGSKVMSPVVINLDPGTNGGGVVNGK